MAKRYIANAFSINMLPLGEGEKATVTITRISPEFARQVAATTAFESAVGHEATAQLLTAVLGVTVPYNRVSITLSAGDTLIVAMPAVRLPEGKVLSIEELQQINFYLVTVA